MTVPERINKILTPILKRRGMSKFNGMLADFRSARSDLFVPVDRAVLARHKALWSQFGLPFSSKWLLFYCNISGVVDYRYLPQDLYIAKIEKILNNCTRAGGEAEDKNQYSLFIRPEHQPRFALRYIRGMFFDEDYGFVSDQSADDILSQDQGDLIGKIAISSGGGHGVKGLFYKKNGYYDKNGMRITASWIRQNMESYVIQEKIKQCAFSAQFNAPSANTCRIVTFRRPWDGQTVVIKAGMRFGASNDVFDNLSSGGVGICLGEKGFLCKYAYNDLNRALPRYTAHPTSHIQFEGQQHPYYKQMCDVACAYAARIPNYNLISWDFVADQDGNVKILEINETTQSTDWLQYSQGPFFGDLTEQVVDWCLANQRYDNFKYFRA